MNYPSPNEVELFSEVDIREAIITPFLSQLGYGSGSSKIRREIFLKYPYSQLGRKKPGKDPPLKGKADYVLEVENKVRWVIETKPSNEIIDEDSIEQAYSYANHPGVRAVYFLMCNGKEFRLYLTSHSPNAKPLITLTYEKFISSQEQLKNILYPDSILRNFSDKSIDIGKPLGPGLGSLAKIQSGRVTVQSSNPEIDYLAGLNTAILDGSISRDENHNIVAFLSSLSLNTDWQEFNKKVGAADFEIICEQEKLSIDKTKPSEFKNNFIIKIPNLFYLQLYPKLDRSHFPEELEVQIQVLAQGYLDRKIFKGEYRSQTFYNLSNFPQLELIGDFEIKLI